MIDSYCGMLSLEYNMATALLDLWFLWLPEKNMNKSESINFPPVAKGVSSKTIPFSKDV